MSRILLALHRMPRYVCFIRSSDTCKYWELLHLIEEQILQKYSLCHCLVCEHFFRPLFNEGNWSVVGSEANIFRFDNNGHEKHFSSLVTNYYVVLWPVCKGVPMFKYCTTVKICWRVYTMHTSSYKISRLCPNHLSNLGWE